ncbi:hypothetical protein GCM10025867_08700 [Frondihabitans sucicola]|uniref:Sigma-70 family RNA polymerase sigma factor n=1 Tax=Frondihabitans sucicola TaxID=1268041 RepID=A0ABM8GJS7_9MICO|nr:sigma-70 family RNA polymerase sigma factor [Frondihabitans sucicola]BDZ48629.1 hypothetical protein GCM10025867_08700 [Frondihabitans sucicola]
MAKGDVNSSLSGFAADAWLQHRETLLRVAFATLYSAGLQDEVEDVVLEVATALLEHPPADVVSWEAFLVTMTKRRAIDHIRSKHVRNREGSDYDLESQDAESHEIDDLLDGIDTRSYVKKAEEVLESLSPQEQAIARGCLWEQRPQQEVADELRITQARVSQVLRSARTKLRTAIEDQEGGKA